MTEPTAPIRLITALARLRRGLGVRSGIRATAGERYSPMESSTSPRATKNSTKFCWAAAMGMITANTAESSAPTTMKGIRRPSRVWVRSLRAPSSGRRNSARTLSSAIIAPLTVSPKWKLFLRISGMILSYSCQNAQIDRKAKPTKKVRL